MYSSQRALRSRPCIFHVARSFKPVKRPRFPSLKDPAKGSLTQAGHARGRQISLSLYTGLPACSCLELASPVERGYHLLEPFPGRAGLTPLGAAPALGLAKSGYERMMAPQCVRHSNHTHTRTLPALKSLPSKHTHQPKEGFLAPSTEEKLRHREIQQPTDHLLW